jgi:N-methylhydantoinase A
MGGTSTDVSLCDGEPRETMESYVDGLPVRAPMLEIHTVGAGGGSLARVDSGGLLRVGPESAGADPGPACYGKGDEPAVTDAHVVLGRIAEEQFLGGAMRIDAARARAAVGRVAARLGLGETEAAAGILRVANATMDRAIRVVSVERGYDPRDFALLAFGGCGGLHACDLAEGLGISVVLAPKLAGALSALGMLLAGEVRDYAAGVLGRAEFASVFRELERRARRELRGAALERHADLRYRGQSYELTVPWVEAEPGAPFHVLHEKTYGYALPEREIEVVTLRVRARRAAPPVSLLDAAPSGHGRAGARRLYAGGAWHEAPAVRREQLGRRGLSGPALVLDYGSTTLVAPGWRALRDRTGMLVLRRGG